MTDVSPGLRAVPTADRRCAAGELSRPQGRSVGAGTRLGEFMSMIAMMMGGALVGWLARHAAEERF